MGPTEGFVYNSLGQVTRHQRKNGWYRFADCSTTPPYQLKTLWNPVNTSTRPNSGPNTAFTYYVSPNVWAGRVKDITDPLLHKTTYEYDLSFDANGVQTTTPCSGRGLVTKIIYSDGKYKNVWLRQIRE